MYGYHTDHIHLGPTVLKKSWGLDQHGCDAEAPPSPTRVHTEQGGDVLDNC